MDLASRFAAALPGRLFLDPAQPQALQEFLHQAGWIARERRIVSLDKAGEGNMNLVLRLQLDDGSSRVIKQARPWVEKFPSVEAPAERANIEARYYAQTARHTQLAAHSPRLLAADSQAHLLLLEDLGAGTDLSRLYAQGQELDSASLSTLLAYLSALHGAPGTAAGAERIANRAMRALNAEHIFRFPFATDNGLDLDTITPGLAALARDCREDTALMAAVQPLEARYLADGDTLVHGDFFPGSILQTAQGLRVIDPEFCFHGDAEFDVGVLLAHLHLAAQPAALRDQVLADYQAPPGFSRVLCAQFTGIEILRRLLGLAQLPLEMDLAAKTRLVERARRLLLDSAAATSTAAA